MKLDRNITNPRRGKYALIKLREAKVRRVNSRVTSDNMLEVNESAVDFGNYDNDFFVIRLKDKYAGPALRAYANAARLDDPEYAGEVDDLALNAETHPSKKRPD